MPFLQSEDETELLSCNLRIDRASFIGQTGRMDVVNSSIKTSSDNDLHLEAMCP